MITVIAGVNGAGKSSIAGAFIRDQGGDYFNPDEVAHALIENDRSLLLAQANAHAWKIGFDQLAQAIDDDANFILETTLGGTSITKELHRAIDLGRQFRILYVGLASVQLHIERVEARVARGGHHIPPEKIHERWKHSVRNVIGLIPRCDAVRVFDNSAPLDQSGPRAKCLFSLLGDAFDVNPTDDMPAWAEPLAGVALKRVAGRR